MQTKNSIGAAIAGFLVGFGITVALTALNISLFFAAVFRPFDYGIAYCGCVAASIAGASALGLMTRNRWPQVTFAVLGWAMFWLLVIAEHASSEGNPDHRLDWIPWLHIAASIGVFGILTLRPSRSN